MDKLGSSELLLKESSSETAGAWLSNYANDLFEHPGQHLPELGLAGLAVGIGSAVAARRLIAELLLSPADELVLKATAQEAAKKSSRTAGETFARMDGASVSDTIRMLSTRDGLQISSWGASHIQGSRGAQQSVLRSSDLAAMQIKRGEETLYAHKISVGTSGDTVASYYTYQPMNLKNPWLADEALGWPLHRGGPFDGLKNAGVHVMDLAERPIGLHYNPALTSLTVKWTSDLRAITSKPMNALNAMGESVRLAAGDSIRLSSIEIKGAKAVMKGQGEIALRLSKATGF